MSKKVVSVSGLIGAGKDTVANYLIGELGYHRISFSAALKDAVAAIFGWDRDMLEGSTKAAREAREAIDLWWSKALGYDISPRKALQLVGTDVMRDNFCQDIWVLALKRRIQEISSIALNPRVVGSDARFFNEIAMIGGQEGGTNVRVVRGEIPWEVPFQKTVEERVREQIEYTGDWQALEMSVTDVAQVVRYNLIKVAKEMRIDVHPSDLEHVIWNKYTAVIRNDGSLHDLYDKVDALGL